MVNMYPHRLFVVSVESSMDEDGYVTSSEGNEVFLGYCRMEQPGKASQLTKEDGTQVYASATIYASSLNGEVESGNIVCVRDSYGKQLMRKTVINCLKTQLHTRIWV